LRQPNKIGTICFLFGALCCMAAQTSPRPSTPAFADPSPHRIQMVKVEENVQLEVLDWGGTGRPVVLLAGWGNTAHIYDDLAPLLAENYHVYGITRRGYGASSAPAAGYSVHRLGDDVVAVLDALKINRPILVAHSFAGKELSSVATRFPDRIAAAVYLDAAYGYAFYDPAVGNLTFDISALQKKLEQLSNSQGDVKLIEQLLQNDLPLVGRDLQQQKQYLDLIARVPADRARPTAADMASFTAFSAWYAQNMVGGNPPEIELHLSFESNPDGSVGKPRSHPDVSAEDAKWEQFTNLRVPVLAIFACPVDYGPSIDRDPVLREKLEAYNTANCQSQAKALEKGVPSSRVLLWPRSYHYLFIARRDNVLKELRSFADSLPQ